MPLILIFMMLANFPSVSTIEPLSPDKGPRTEDLIIRFYADVEAAYAALKAGDIDAIGYEITSDLYADAITDPNVVLGPVGDRGKYQFDLNSNYTAQSLNDGRRSPTNYKGFRQGIAFCVDKDLIVDTFCGGFADRIDQPMAYMHRGWRNQSYWYEDGTYPYEYNLVSASNAFDNAGFVQGATANPDYDAGIPGSAPNLRIHPDLGTTMNPLEVCSRTDDARRLEAGRQLCDTLRLCGVPVNSVEADSSVLYPKVMDNLDYHVYTGGWNLGRFPAMSAYGLYHHSQYFLGGSNYVTGNDSMGNPAHPQYNDYLYGARYPSSYSEAQSFAKLAFGAHVDECITVELFSAKSFWAWSSDLLGVVNAVGTGLENGYTFMNAYKVGGGEVRYGLKTPPNAMNKIYSQWYYDYQCLDRMDLYGGVDVPPYDLSVDQPGFVTERLVGMWYDVGANKSKITYTYRSDVYFVEPVTGNQLENVNASHVYASIWYDYQIGDGWFWSDVQDVHHLNLVDPNTIEIYFDSYSYWNAYAAQPPIKSFNLLRKGFLSVVRTETITGFTGPGFLGLSHKPFWVTSITGLGGLTQGTDWEIVRNGPGGYADVYIYKAGTGDIDIIYYSAEDATGYTPGNLPWEDALEGAGAWYATAFTPGLGGNLTLRKPFYYIDTPLLGEIDWVKKPNGCYKIDIFDVVIAASAYGSQGTGVPSSNWFAGADVALPGGKIDIFDIVTVTSKYCQECAPMGFFFGGSAYSFAW